MYVQEEEVEVRRFARDSEAEKGAASVRMEIGRT